MSFVGLHTHSDYSLLDGASQLDALVDRAVKLGMPAIALTDHGVMYGAIELIKLCRAKNIRAIVGNEMYVVNGDIKNLEKGKKKYHQIVLAKNTQGYKNLVKLTTISHLEGWIGNRLFGRPCINKELLAQYHQGLIVTSGCRAGEIPQNILQGKLEEARAVAKWYKDLFGEDYYIEIQDHGYKEDRIVNVEIVKIAQELEIKIVATNDSHFTSCSDVEAHDALLCIQTQQKLEDEKRMRYSGTEYLKSAEEMGLLFRDHLSDDVIQEAIANTLEVSNKIKSYDIFGEPRLPDYPVPPDHNHDTFLEKTAREGLQERFNRHSYAEIDLVYRERLDYELKMMQKMGFSTYFLVVWDYIKYARDNNIPVGPGRGSAAGSLVAYALKITNIDPVHHGLLFERFLNPERKSMPDIDTDFCIENRDKVIEYVTQKYGKDRVAQIITFNRLTSKSVLKDVARVLGIPYKESDEMAKLIPVTRGKPTKLKVMISNDTPDAKFKEKYDNDPQVRHWVDMAMRIEGTNKTFGVHAAGVVISAQPLDEIVPLQKNNDGSVITQYFMEDLESLGLLKMDFLGLRNLTIIQKALDFIKLTTGLEINPDSLTADERLAYKILLKGEVNKRPREVEKTYENLAKGDLEGIFQLESSGMLDVVQKLKPSSIEDISSILALYRPGPLDAGLIPKFIDRKHGREEIIYEHRLLEPILSETYAVLVYQEQIMKMAQDLAGYSLGQADLLRRSMGKKKPEEMQKHRETFIDGSAQNGIKRSIAEDLFDQMVKFAEYCFNKSHSTAYAYVTYQTAYLKANYPVEYMAALLTANSGDQDKVKKYIANCLNMGITVEGPDINRSGIDFTPLQKTILFGLSAVRNVGEGAIANILAARKEGGPFTSLIDLVNRINLEGVTNRNFEALIKCGAFDSINPNRQQLIEHLHLAIKWVQSCNKERESGQLNIFNTETNVLASAPQAPNVADYSNTEKLQMEKELLGFYVSAHPLKLVPRLTEILQVDPAPINLSDIPELKKSKHINTIVAIAEIKLVTTKKGERMAILKIEDLTGSIEAVVFPKTYESVQASLIQDETAIVKGKIDRRDEQTQLIVEEVKLITLDDLKKAESILYSPIEEPQLVLSEAIPSEDSSPKPQQNVTTGQIRNPEATPPENLSHKQPQNVTTQPDRFLMLKMTPQQVQDEELLKRLKAILQEHSSRDNKATVAIIATIEGKNRFAEAEVSFGSEFWVQNHNRVLDALKSAKFNAYVRPING